MSQLRVLACVLALGVVITIHPALAQKSILSLDELHKIEDISAPVFAPNGTKILYAVSGHDVGNDAVTSDLWVTDWQGGAPQQLTMTPLDGESAAKWSPDGTFISFLSDQGVDETSQIWLVPETGGLARQLTQGPFGVVDYNWSPDGRFILFTAEDAAPAPRLNEQGEEMPPTPFTTTRFQFKYDTRDYLDHRRIHLYRLNVETGAVVQLSHGDSDEWFPTWSPKGDLIAYVSKRGGDTDRHTNYDVYVMPPEPGSTPRKLGDFAGADNDPEWGSPLAWSPDGRKIAWLRTKEDKWFFYGPIFPVIGDVESGEVRLAAEDDHWYSRPQWSTDGDTLYVLREDNRTMRLISIDTLTNAVKTEQQGNLTAYDFTVHQQRIAVLESRDRMPSRLVSVGAKPREIVNPNSWISDIALSDYEDFEYISDGVTIHGLLLKPNGYKPGKRYPMIVYVHGGPVSQFAHEFMFNWHYFAANGYLVMGVNPRGSSAHGFDFAKTIYADWGNLDVRDVLAGVDHLVAKGLADPERLGVGGWSYGGMLTNYLIASDTRFKAAVSGAGTGNILGTYGNDQYAREYEFELGTPWRNKDVYERVSFPFLHADRIKTPTIFQCAEKDYNVPCIGSEQMYLALRSQDIPTVLTIYPGENHGLTVPSYIRHRWRQNIEWFDRYLKQ